MTRETMYVFSAFLSVIVIWLWLVYQVICISLSWLDYSNTEILWIRLDFVAIWILLWIADHYLGFFTVV